VSFLGSTPAGQGARGEGGAFYVQGGVPVGGGIRGALSLTDASLRSNVARGGSGARGGSAPGGAIATDGAHLSPNRVQVLANAAQSGDGTTSTGAASGGGAAFVSLRPEFLQPVKPPARVVTVINGVFADNAVRLGAGTPGGDTSGGGGALFLGVSAGLTFTTF